MGVGLKTFAAQLKTPDHLLDVVIRLGLDDVEIRSAATSLGRWPRADVTFERQSESSYRFSADGETVAVRIADDTGFRDALDLMRAEHIPLVPRSLGIAGVAAISAAIAFMTLTSSEAPVAADPSPTVSSTLQAATADPVPTTLPPGPDPETLSGAELLTARWNGYAAGTPIALPESGRHVVSGHLTIETAADGIEVTALPSADVIASERLITALGLTIAAADPTLEPSQRARVLEDLGLDIDGDNTAPLAATASLNGVTYTLQFEPGELLVFSAGLEW
ncbi:MAG: hypothetical protein ACFCVC_03395 [Acidimicrobiia bacterium]